MIAAEAMESSNSRGLVGAGRNPLPSMLGLKTAGTAAFGVISPGISNDAGTICLPRIFCHALKFTFLTDLLACLNCPASSAGRLPSVLAPGAEGALAAVPDFATAPVVCTG